MITIRIVSLTTTLHYATTVREVYSISSLLYIKISDLSFTGVMQHEGCIPSLSCAVDCVGPLARTVVTQHTYTHVVHLVTLRLRALLLDFNLFHRHVWVHRCCLLLIIIVLLYNIYFVVQNSFLICKGDFFIQDCCMRVFGLKLVILKIKLRLNYMVWIKLY